MLSWSKIWMEKDTPYKQYEKAGVPALLSDRRFQDNEYYQ